ncbi:exodeoxyribonuclease V subunit beta [Quisquiliibacterium transsilvanicum]|uniref:RecBCD enzyme subunit RecB n=1 Tax=Quisquiliibacterium transsilvanicum TaxID=1549638 RepID=A0A7W8M7P9_9BURK|nr:exodeoxyribonuclease V subunit beta [Quisquiliibacterium transsilvanicum]MBB5271226.1 exodeoxyribonuclease V beta subunit [Quisquiliibacterium transsilvanicum]
MSHLLDAATFPLHGSRLIEASAGTGKTWTIAALYLRLVLGHGPEGARFGRALLPAEILVMTFTRAATKELSDRIRARLIEAGQCFRGDATPQPGDTLLSRLLADHPDPADRTQAAWRLSMAAEAMDDAAVFTIDAWCQRMLREHAFDSGNAFDEELDADEDALFAEATQDYWRQQCYPLSAWQLRVALGVWPDVQALAKDMRALVGKPLPATDDNETLGGCIDRVQGGHDATLEQMSEGWVERAQRMKEWIDAQLAEKPCGWEKSLLKSNWYPNWLALVAVWARDPKAAPLQLTEPARRRLIPAGMLEARKADAPPIHLPEDFAALEALLEACDALPDPRVALRLHAAGHVARRMAELKRRARRFGFADMLHRLDDALAGPQRQRLRERILAQYPVALIDEFQDTSPLQYRIFDALYRAGANDPDSALLLIGDPKQSIYGFRGADILSYLQARRATVGRHYALGTNYRSTGPLVAAVNDWFTQAEARDGDGAFMFRSTDDDPLPFEPASARGREERLRSTQGPVPALTVEYDLQLLSATDSRRLFAARCAERIVGWLNDEAAGFDHPQAGFQRLRPADIAVLVRTGIEASAVRRELRQRGVASVYLSDKDSVFASDEARDLVHWLRAVASPLDARLVRAALATRTVGLPIEELIRLAGDDEAFDARSEQVRELHGVWRDQGVLTMLRQTLHLLDLPARWLAEPDGERRLTNFLHLAELLQNASGQLEGEQAAIRWLGMQIEGGEGTTDEQVLRLESDADLVKVVTVHKSKGLEYPVVCLPFPCSFRRVERKNTSHLNLPDDSGHREVKLQYSDAELQRADRERLREDLRLFYVALTRARHALWMGFAAIKVGNGNDCLTHLSAAGYLLGGPQARGPSDWLAPLEALAVRAAGPDGAVTAAGAADGATDVAAEGASVGAESRAGAPRRIVLRAAGQDLPRTALRAREAPPPLQDRPPYDARFERSWSLGSFSSLVRDLPAPPLSPTQGRRPAADEQAGSDALPMPGASPAANLPPWHRFPGGPLAGDFLHGLLEWLAAEGFALAGDEALAAGLRRRCERAGHGQRADELVDWMRAILATPLPSLGVPLQELRVQQAELEFWLPSEQLRASAVDAGCRQALLGGRARPELPQRVLHGMLMGFADLVFEHQGRYWVLDYKSNRLGEHGADYDRAALEAAMAHHRYDVQAAIYLLALHRLLRARLGPSYDPARQLGGALYLFLRGIDGPERGEYAIAADARVLGLLDTLDRALAAEEAQA